MHVSPKALQWLRTFIAFSTIRITSTTGELWKLPGFQTYDLSFGLNHSRMDLYKSLFFQALSYVVL